MSDLSFEFLNWQREVYTANSRFSVVVAGRRTGKTRFAAVMLVIKALQCTHKDATVLYAAPTYSMARVLMWDLVCELARPVTAKVNISDGEVTLINGVKIRIRGADHPDSLRGYKLFYAVLDESKDMRETVWPLIIRPALSDLKGGALIIGTPEPGESQFRTQYELGQRGVDNEWKSWLFPTMCNELIDPTEIEAARRTLSTAQFEQEFNANFDTAGSDLIKMEWLKFDDNEPKQGDYWITVDLAGFEAVADPTKKKHLDFTAIAVTKVTEDGKWWVKKIEHGRWDVRETAVRVLNAIRTYKPIMVGIEKGSLHRAFAPYLMDLARKNGIFTHIEVVAIGSASKVSRITMGIQGLLEHGRITFNSRENWDEFKREVLAFPSPKAHDDLLDALSLLAHISVTSYMRSDDSASDDYEVLSDICGF